MATDADPRRPVAVFTIVLIGVGLSYALSVNLLSMFESTMCLRFAGGSGCPDDAAGAATTNATTADGATPEVVVALDFDSDGDEDLVMAASDGARHCSCGCGCDGRCGIKRLASPRVLHKLSGVGCCGCTAATAATAKRKKSRPTTRDTSQ